MRALLLVVAVAGCIRDNLVTCEDGSTCPADTLCDPVHSTCILPEQATACEGQTQGAACEFLGAAGVCLEEVCFPPRCGDGEKSIDEACDDGNTAEGDTCSADCRTSHICGDGVLEPALGEACDDENTTAHDGCDATCQDEELTWSLRQCGEPWGSGSRNGRIIGYDPVRRRVVVVTADRTSEWDGDRWACFDAPIGRETFAFFLGTAFDSIRKRLWISAIRSGGSYLYEWDGVAWTSYPVDRAFSKMVFDPMAGELVAYDASERTTLYRWSFGASTWRPQTPTLTAGPVTNPIGMVLLPEQQEIVALAAPSATASDARTYVYSFSSNRWTAGSVLPGFPFLVYDEGAQRLLAISTSAVYERGLADPPAGIWTASQETSSFRSIQFVHVDTATGDLGVFAEPLSPEVQIFDSYTYFRRTGSQWSPVEPAGLMQRAPGALVFDALVGKLLSVTDTATLAWSGTEWAPHAPAAPFLPRSGVFDAATGSVVASDGREVARLGTTGWTSAPVNPVFSRLDMLYDANRQRILAVAGADPGERSLYALTGNQWTSIGEPLDGSPSASLDATFDISTGRVVAVLDTTLFELRESAWRQIFAFDTGGYRALSFPRRASTFFVGGSNQPIWERIGDSWRLHTAPPAPAAIERWAAHPTTGEMLGITSQRAVYALSFD